MKTAVLVWMTKARFDLVISKTKRHNALLKLKTGFRPKKSIRTAVNIIRRIKTK